MSEKFNLQLIIVKVNKRLNFSNASKNDKKVHLLKQKSTVFDRFLVKLDKIAQKLGNSLKNILKTKSPQSLPNKLSEDSIAKSLNFLNQIYRKKITKFSKIFHPELS